MRPFGNSPDAWGAHKIAHFPHQGPTSYAQIVVGTPVTGGDTVQALEGGLKDLIFLDGGDSDDGRFGIEAIPVTSSQTTTASSSLSGIPSKTYKLRWIAKFTGAFGGQAQTAGTEVVAGTNLSTVFIRLQGFGTSS